MIEVVLESVTDWEGFSRATRGLLADGVAPDEVHWRCLDEAAPDLFDEPASVFAPATEPPALNLPRAFVEAARDVFLHADADRFALLHRMTERISGAPAAWNDSLHPDRLRFDRMLQEVRREIHKMHAFVRFRPMTEAGESDGAPARYVAWFEPAHHVAERAAGFFARRFSTMHWAILTPRVGIEWNGKALVFGAGTTRDAAPAADAGEALWLDYYRSIFNPARVKISMMKKEMPVRFWPNLPESAAIGPLIVAASQRQSRMIEDRADESLRPRMRTARAQEDSTGDVANPIAPIPIETLRREALQCTQCPIAAQATQVVFGEGDPAAQLMIVGEQPGDVEDLRGRPFQGPAGQLLHAAFDELGWDPARLWVTNAVKHFHHELRGKRRMHKTPGQLEAMECLHWLESEIRTIAPKAIVALGATAARSLLGRPVPVTANEGTWIERHDGIPVLVCLHPAAVLRAEGAARSPLRAHWIDTLRAADAYAGDSALVDQTTGG